MIFIIEVLLLIAGLWAIITGQVPSLLFGGGKYQIEGLKARFFGVLLVFPLPVAIAGTIVLVVVLGEGGLQLASLLEVGLLLSVCIIAAILARFIGVPLPKSTKSLIAKKVNGSLIYSLFGGTGFGAIAFCPLAIVYALQAYRLINENPVYAPEYRFKAQLACIISIGVALVWGVFVTFFVLLALTLR